MIKNKKSKCVKSGLLLLSTLLLPIQSFSIAFYFIPLMYIDFIVPYWIWKIWFGKNKQKIQISSLCYKIPVILFLAFTMFYTDIILIFIIFATEIPLIGKIIIFVLLLFLLRCLTYAMMIFIWQPNIIKLYKVWGYIGVTLYCIVNSYFIYSTQNAPDTDDYSIPLTEYLK